MRDVEYVCIIVYVWKRFSLSSSMVSFREELHLKCATLSNVKICSCSCVQLCVHANKGRKKMKTNHLVAPSNSLSLPLSHTLSNQWLPNLKSCPDLALLPFSAQASGTACSLLLCSAVLYAISSSKHVELSPAEVSSAWPVPFIHIFQLKGTLKKCSLKVASPYIRYSGSFLHHVNLRCLLV